MNEDKICKKSDSNVFQQIPRQTSLRIPAFDRALSDADTAGDPRLFFAS
jgi:hypothetical protein